MTVHLILRLTTAYSIKIFLSQIITATIGILILFVNSFNSLAQPGKPSSQLLSLELAIQQVLKETNTPAIGIALVSKDNAIWIDGFGKANIERRIDADENTLFRIASISKMFVALSILKLQEEGTLNLQDKVHDLAPEIKYTNEWEDTHPIRIVHLLEHTTGWDDYHLTEQVSSPITLKEGLDYHPHSRTSRWVPGTRMAYCNSGSGVAAYIIEKVSGQPYENYVKEHFFKPLKMRTTTFFNDSVYQKRGATLYDGNNKPLDYRHVIQRPAGSINSTASEMANLVRFFLQRGTTDSLRLLSEKSILRMELPQSTPASKGGLQLGYGLANFTSIHNGFIYHGHNGGVPGALSELAYLPEYGIGHVFFINAGNSNAFTRISTLIRDFETQSLRPDSLVRESLYSGGFEFSPGYYVSINPRIQWAYFMDRLIDIYKFEANDKLVLQSWILPGKKTVFYPVSESAFRPEKSDKIIMVKAFDPLAGEVLYNNSQVLKPIPAFVVFGQIGIALLWIALMITGIFMWAVAYFRYWIWGYGKSLVIRRNSSIASLLFFIGASLLTFSGKHYNGMLQAPGFLSVSLMLISLLFVMTSVWSLVGVFKSRNENINKVTFLHMGLLSGLHLLVTIYLVYYGVIPIITWA